jgi:predicted phage terminase large subunit-like protein
MGYVNHMWSNFVEGNHHRIMGEAFDRIISGELKRLIINLGPRHTKSEFASVFLPSKYLGHHPDRKVIQSTHTAELSYGFGRRVRNMVASREYANVFPDTSLAADSKAAGRWSTSKGGEYHAVGIGAKIAGKGADLFIVDDAHSEQDYIRALGGESAAFDDAYEWYQTGPRQRLQPGAAIVVVMTRWHLRDLTGRLIRRMTQNPRADQWELIEFPAILPSGNALWPEFWPLEELLKTKEELSVQQWNAQYLQNPTADEGALVKREWWRTWKGDESPKCDYVIQSWDTAFTAKERSDYSACTTWGVFYREDEETGHRVPNIILLHAFRKRMEFPELKSVAHRMWKDRQPDSFLIEGRASGQPLIQELRRMGIPVTEYTPSRGNDKVVRVNAVTDLFSSGAVWVPDRRWAEEVIEEFAAFPVGEHDDFVDSSTQALIRFRQGGFVSLGTDEDMETMPRRTADYY